ncbi:dTDP-4-dehydrorhamnose reductase [Psychroserpens mesophilus]|uniref:dTDP-4-dehydrorhamnose reductase n=1 Tax=Psychroserpens mesophilus TaxID=325473 RepID=UPI003D64B22B
MNILVTGANGQLATCIRSLDHSNIDYNFIYKNSSELDIVNIEAVKTLFKSSTINYCINCAAYTAVDTAESDSDKAYDVNVKGSENLAKVCHEFNTTLIHISTDFVFEGSSKKPYNETHSTNPLNIYGSTKLEGEQKIQHHLDKYFILRTSWLYSEFGNNFLKTMLRLSKDRDEIGVVSDQIGTPTYAMDLARVILKIIQTNNTSYGIYHYSNEGVASWYDFALAIFDLNKIKITVNPITTQDFPTPAKRPSYSVLDKSKIKKALKVEIPHWTNSLKKAISNL